MSDINKLNDLSDFIKKLYPDSTINDFHHKINENTFIGTTDFEKYLKIDGIMQNKSETRNIKLGNIDYTIYLANINEEELVKIYGEDLIKKHKINFENIKEHFQNNKKLPVVETKFVPILQSKNNVNPIVNPIVKQHPAQPAQPAQPPQVQQQENVKKNPPPQSKEDLITYKDYENLANEKKLVNTTHIFDREELDPWEPRDQIDEFSGQNIDNFDEYFQEMKKSLLSTIENPGGTILWLGYSIQKASKEDKEKFNKKWVEEKPEYLTPYYEHANDPKYIQFWNKFIKFMDDNTEMKKFIFETFNNEQTTIFSGGKRRTRKSKITRKSVRKHRGVIQLGGRAGKLRKGFKYTGNRTKTGLAEILKL